MKTVRTSSDFLGHCAVERLAAANLLDLWMLKDPAGYVDGTNRYEMVLDNPVNRLDPSGLETWTRTGGTEVAKAGGTVKLGNGDTGTIRVWKDYQGQKGSLRFAGGHIELEFTTNDSVKKSCGGAHWIQFTSRVYLDRNNKPIDEVYLSGNGVYQRTNKSYLDTSWTAPESVYYDAYGEHSSSDTEMSMIDGPSLPYGAAYSKVSILADAFLVVDKQVYWHVHWEEVGTPDANRQWRLSFESISGGPADSLGDYNQKLFLLGYSDPAGSDPVNYTNPLSGK